MRKVANSELGRIDATQYVNRVGSGVVVVLDNVRSAQNVGSFFRTADAFGVDKIIICGISAVPPSKEIHKTALGAELVVPWSFFDRTMDAILELKRDGYKIIAIEQVEGAVSLENYDKSGERVALIFGNEVEGVDQNVVDACDCGIEIPQCGTKHSLNVSVAAGVVLWHFYNKQR